MNKIQRDSMCTIPAIKALKERNIFFFQFFSINCHMCLSWILEHLNYWLILFVGLIWGLLILFLMTFEVDYNQQQKMKKMVNKWVSRGSISLGERLLRSTEARLGVVSIMHAVSLLYLISVLFTIWCTKITCDVAH